MKSFGSVESKKITVDALKKLKFTDKNICGDELLEMIQNDLIKFQNNNSTVKKPIIIIDIDGTLLDNLPRQIKIFKKVLTTEFPILQGFKLPKYEYLKSQKIYSILSIINQWIPNPFIFAEIKVRFLDAFLSNDFLEYDILFPGVKEFIEEIKLLPLQIWLLSGRIENQMKSGTIDKLKQTINLIDGKNCKLLMKQDINQKDIKYKKKIFNSIKISNEIKIIGFIDNESSICSLFKRDFGLINIIHFNSSQSNHDEFQGLHLTSWF